MSQLRLKIQAHLFSIVQLDHAEAAVLDIVLLFTQDVEPGWVLGQRFLQLPGSQVDAGHRDRLGRVPDKHVCPKTVVHEVPKEIG